MPPQTPDLQQLLEDNPNVVAAWFDNTSNPTTVHICFDQQDPNQKIHFRPALHGLRADIQRMKPVNILICHPTFPSVFNIHQACQDEPIDLGCQIQPEGANWLGTAGSPCKWIAPDKTTKWGILSNWHVMAAGDEQDTRTQHQPTTAQGPIAQLSQWSPISPGQPHKIDAAIADAKIQGFHTISNEILGIGWLGDHSIDAEVGLRVKKAGRTTAVTHGVCTAVGAAVRVGYGDFEATFTDQDVFSPTSGVFSSPGDSGSLIVGEECRCPTSLLFAGNSLLTIGNPMRHVNEAFDLIYPFP